MTCGGVGAKLRSAASPLNGLSSGADDSPSLTLTLRLLLPPCWLLPPAVPNHSALWGSGGGGDGRAVAKPYSPPLLFCWGRHDDDDVADDRSVPDLPETVPMVPPGRPADGGPLGGAAPPAKGSNESTSTIESEPDDSGDDGDDGADDEGEDGCARELPDKYVFSSAAVLCHLKWWTHAGK
jgi:hypothetical protein